MEVEIYEFIKDQLKIISDKIDKNEKERKSGEKDHKKEHEIFGNRLSRVERVVYSAAAICSGIVLVAGIFGWEGIKSIVSIAFNG